MSYVGEPLTISYGLGLDEHVITSYRVVPTLRTWARTTEAVPEAYSVHGIRVWGDEQEQPNELEVTTQIAAASLVEAYATAYGIVRDSESAHHVRTHLGTRSVDGLLGFRVTPGGPAEVELSLRFAPKDPP